MSDKKGKIASGVLISAVFLAVLVIFHGQALANSDLSLRRVMLSTGGVGYFEYEATVDPGDQTLLLDVRLDQVDDVLKSIVVYDDNGRIGAIDLPGREPLSQVFRDLPFDHDELSSPVSLLNALQGARVTISGPRGVTGRIIRVVPESVDLGNGRGTIVRHRASLLTDDGLRQFVLEDAEAVQFEDPELRDQIDHALAAIARYRVRDRRTLRLKISGTKKRKVRVAYVAGAPLWKATYRLTLSDDGGHLQGWAVVENPSGKNWDGVELTLQSGNPVTFRQALYTTYYVDRPEVPVEVLGRILPKPDEGSDMQLAADMDPASSRLLRTMKKIRAQAPRGMSGATMSNSEVKEELSPGAPANIFAAQATEVATQVLFKLPMPVSVAAGHSLIVPIINRRVPVLRIAYYQASTHPRHPLAAVSLTNDGTSGLPPGVLSLYQRNDKQSVTAYIGDARLSSLPAGEKRLLSYALDQKIRIDKSVKIQRRIVKHTINKGVYRRTVVDRRLTTYRVNGPVGNPLNLIIDHPRRSGWKLLAPTGDDIEVAEKDYRLKAALDKDGKAVVSVVSERPREETVALSTLVGGRIGIFLSEASLQPDIRRAFERMSSMMMKITDLRRNIESLEKKKTEVFTDQVRLRENLKRVPREGDLYKRYLDKLNAQEDRLEVLYSSIEKTRTDFLKAEDTLAEYIATLDI